jgi:Plasmid encoded RepA protein
MRINFERIERYRKMIQDRREPDLSEICRIPRVLVHCTLPQSDPGPVDHWERSQNGVRIIIHPYIWSSGENTSKHMKNPPQRRYPYGSPARLLLFEVGWEAMSTGNRKIMLSRLFKKFCARYEVRTTHGHQRDKLMDQMMRLFRCTIEFKHDTCIAKRWRFLRFTDEGYAAWDEANFPGRLTNDSYIVLNEHFYKALMDHPVPVDLRALQALRHSAMCLDLYSWGTYTTFLVSNPANGAKPEPQLFTWKQLSEQFGCSYQYPSEFREKLPHVLRQVKQVYPELTVELMDEGLKLYPSRPAVLPQKKELTPIG